jgi:hypothetical protein
MASGERTPFGCLLRKTPKYQSNLIDVLPCTSVCVNAVNAMPAVCYIFLTRMIWWHRAGLS